VLPIRSFIASDATNVMKMMPLRNAYEEHAQTSGRRAAHPRQQCAACRNQERNVESAANDAARNDASQIAFSLR
jgi:hypothetical protein